MFRSLTLLAAALLSPSAASPPADDAVLAQMYGSGVHAYFSRDYLPAYEYLTAAIEGGSTDPRCYYFRGLTYVKLGREPDAEIDFAKGAELESRDVDALYDVARSLGRVQGSTRLLIERYRVKARMAALKHAEQVHRARYEAARAEESRVLHPPIETAPGLPGEASAKPGVQPAPKPAPEKPIPEDVFEQPPVQPLPEGPLPKSPLQTPPAGKKPTVEPAPGPTGEQPAELPFETPPAGKKPTVEPAPGPTGGAVKSGSIFSALGKALGKAITGDRQLPPLPIGPGGRPGILPDEGGDDPFELEPKVGPPPKTPPAMPPDILPKVSPVPPPAAPPVTPPQVPPEAPDNPFDDQPPGKPSNEPVPEPPGDNPFGN